ncbi:MAG: terminase small subunit, partial [Reyranellaceae bacterium]
MTDHKPLSTRHERFVQEYLRDGNATRAYVRAGYSPRHAQSSASRLLAQPPIEAAVTAGRQRLAEALEVSVERLGREYAKIAFASVRDFVDTGDDGRLRIDLDKASQAQQEGIVDLTVTDHGKASQRVRLKLGKLQALAALTRHVGLFTRKPEPGLTAEDRARYQATIARHERNWEHGLNQLREVAGERDKARIALAAAQATINRLERQAAARAEEPPPG